jgi:uncharacterized protein (TIGR02596 family)
MNAPSRSTPHRAFSIVELLIVIAIVSVLSVLALAGLSSSKRSTDLQTGATAVMDYLALARQAAISGNRPVTVKFYLWENQSSSWKTQNPAQRDSIRLVRSNFDNTRQEEVERVSYLPESAAISANSAFSTLLSDSVSGTAASDDRGTYRSFRFMPDGSIDCSGTESPTLTLLYRTEATATGLTDKNFFTLQIDLQTGTVRYFRPS